MSARLFDHIDLRVRNRKIAQRFYAQVLPAIGFKIDKSGKEWGQFQPGGKPVPFFGFTEDADHKPNGNRIAFWAESRAAVDKIAKIVRKAGGKNVEGPEVCVDYSPGYYAVFHKQRGVSRRSPRWSEVYYFDSEPAERPDQGGPSRARVSGFQLG